MPLYALGLMGMPRRLEHYGNPAWQPMLIVAAAGTFLIFTGIVCLVVQLIVTIRNRRELIDSTGDPWHGRNLEWSTASPPPSYNFAVIPTVGSIDAFAAMKNTRHTAPAPEQYEAIEMPKNSTLGFVLGMTSLAFAFAMVWAIWWLACTALLTVIGIIIIRSWNENQTVCLSAEQVLAMERRRHEAQP